MQQTEMYQLNLIETSDTFSPAPLNENMEKVEAKFAALDGADAALGRRITTLEGLKVVAGSYTGIGGQSTVRSTIQVGFRPRAVILQQATASGDCYIATAAGGGATMTDTGFIPIPHMDGPLLYNYIAIG
ncbi:MAG: hypothetical protein HDT37_07660 [Clostridiales bacterium]|nr:hypothetical protein [Clostridiales bacterium]